MGSQHVHRRDVAEPGIISAFDVYRSVLHADHGSDRPSVNLPRENPPFPSNRDFHWDLVTMRSQAIERAPKFPK